MRSTDDPGRRSVACDSEAKLDEKRAERLKAALRENLRRRKAAARGEQRESAAAEPAERQDGSKNKAG